MTTTQADRTTSDALALAPGAVLLSAFDALGEAVVIAAPWGSGAGLRIVQANPAAARLVGRSQDRIAGRAPRHFLARGNAVALRLLRDRPGVEASIVLTHADGRPIRVHARIARHEPGGYRIAVLRGTDPDDRGTQGLWGRLLETEDIARLGHFSITMADAMVSGSPQFSAIHGLPAGEPTPAQGLLSCYLADDRPRVAAALHQTAQTGAPFDIEARLKAPDGTIRHLRLRGRRHGDGDERRGTVFGIVQDRTDTVVRDRQLEHAQRLQAFGQLAGGVAHDVNNLLAVIMGNSELLRDQASGRLDHEERQMLDDAIAAVERGRSLTDSLLSFARVAPLRPEAVTPERIDSMTRAVLSTTLPVAIRLELETEAGGWPVHADAGNLQSALINLALNATDAMPEGGRLRITVRNHRLKTALGSLPAGPYVAVAVSDTGQGIPPERLPRVCEPFYTTKPVGKGSGLGLARVKGFAEQSGGALRIDSRPGAGTRVTLLLPAHGIAATALDAPDVTLTPSIAPVGARVLLAEDRRDTRRVLRRLLERDGFAVVEAENGDAALRRYAEGEPVDLLVTDLEMPGTLQGPDLARALREARPSLPVVFLSGHAPDPAAGRDGVWLTKPISIRALRAALHDALGSAARG